MYFGAKLRYDLPVPAAVFVVERGRYHSHVSPLAQTAAPAVWLISYMCTVGPRGKGTRFTVSRRFKTLLRTSQIWRTAPVGGASRDAGVINAALPANVRRADNDDSELEEVAAVVVIGSCLVPVQLVLGVLRASLHRGIRAQAWLECANDAAWRSR